MLTPVVLATLAALTLPDTGSSVRVAVDSARHEIVLSVGPVSLPASMHYAHHGPEERFRFDWPVGGWVRGYRAEVVDSSGRAYPARLLHHFGIANLDRRQLIQPVVERLIAAGRETGDVMLPESLGLPLADGQRLMVYYSLVNETNVDVRGATLRIIITWTPAGTPGVRDAYPLIVNANAVVAAPITFDVPPGLSTRSSEFTLPISGRLRVAGAHMHDYATEIRLEDVATGQTLVRLSASRNADGTLRSISRTSFPFTRGGLRLEANRTYRVVAVYQNPTKTVNAGAMAFLAGPFIPDRGGTYPALDFADPKYLADYGWFIDPRAVHHGGHQHP